MVHSETVPEGCASWLPGPCSVKEGTVFAF